jgi:hypothetical protein
MILHTESLKRRGQKLSATLNTLEGVFCHPTVSSMYAFPAITLPEKAVTAAKAKGFAPDEFYCAELLEQTGVVGFFPNYERTPRRLRKINWRAVRGAWFWVSATRRDVSLPDHVFASRGSDGSVSLVDQG